MCTYTRIDIDIRDSSLYLNILDSWCIQNDELFGYIPCNSNIAEISGATWW